MTRAMLGEVRTELIERIEQSKSELRSEIQQVRGELHQVKGELLGELHQVKATLHGLEAGLHAVQADVARIALLVEEQNARNKVVLDGLMAVMMRQERVEHRIDNVEETVRGFAAHSSG